jgi:hypothetical protein
MGEDFSIWLDGAPVIPTPGGDQFSIWLEGAPVLTASDDSNRTVFVTGSRVLVKTGVVTTTYDCTVQITGSNVEVPTGTCTVENALPVTGSVVEVKTGTVTVQTTGDANVNAAGSRVLAKTGVVTVQIVNPTPPAPPGYGGSYEVYPPKRKKKKKPAKYQKRTHYSNLELPDNSEIPVLEPPKPRINVPVSVHLQAQPSTIQLKTGKVRVHIDYPDDFQAIFEALEAIDALKDLPPTNSDDQEAIELVLMLD